MTTIHIWRYNLRAWLVQLTLPLKHKMSHMRNTWNYKLRIKTQIKNDLDSNSEPPAKISPPSSFLVPSEWFGNYAMVLTGKRNTIKEAEHGMSNHTFQVGKRNSNSYCKLDAIIQSWHCLNILNEHFEFRYYICINF